MLRSLVGSEMCIRDRENSMKKSIIGLLAAVAITGGMATIAEAKVNFQIYLGEPYYNYRVGPDYRLSLIHI